MGNDVARRATAEFFGTFWLTFAGCGAAVLAAAWPQLGIGFLGVSLAFGLTVLTMAYAVGHISGGHFNPAVSVGLWAAGRCQLGQIVPYIIAQVAGAIAAAAVLWFIASGKPGWVPSGFAANGFGDLSPGKYGLAACFAMEVLMTGFFLFIIVGATSKGAAVASPASPSAWRWRSSTSSPSPSPTPRSIPPAARARRSLPERNTSPSSGCSGLPRFSAAPSAAHSRAGCTNRPPRPRAGEARPDAARS